MEVVEDGEVLGDGLLDGQHGGVEHHEGIVLATVGVGELVGAFVAGDTVGFLEGLCDGLKVGEACKINEKV